MKEGKLVGRLVYADSFHEKARLKQHAYYEKIKKEKRRQEAAQKASENADLACALPGHLVRNDLDS
jgi:hypothetical protein